MLRKRINERFRLRMQMTALVLSVGAALFALLLMILAYEFNDRPNFKSGSAYRPSPMRGDKPIRSDAGVAQ